MPDRCHLGPQLTILRAGIGEANGVEGIIEYPLELVRVKPADDSLGRDRFRFSNLRFR